MTLNRDVLIRDPTANPIPNDGVTKVGPPTTVKEWNVLAWELTSFVCTGEYAQGLERILSTFLASLDHDTQPAAWVSGFYGSGKSHFVRVLEYLWLDETLPSGSTARGLVHVPQDVRDSLVELTNAGKRAGGQWAAAGKLAAGAGGSFRLAFLGVLFSAAGLPVVEYAPARLALRLLKQGQYEAFLAELAARDCDAMELRDMYVSSALAEALMCVWPGFAVDEREVHQLLREQYPNVTDISLEEMLATVHDVLEIKSTTPGRLPCTLIVLDELEQFINNDAGVILAVQDIVEACSSRFGSTVLFVGTGQSALQANPVLARFQDRFTVSVHLTDTDIETVVRSVILQKKQDTRAELQGVLDSVSGEIDRHLAGTTIAPTAADADDLVPDYPILPSRRRLWEKVLRAVDQGGGGLLRSQLRSTHEAASRVASEPLGHVIGADFIFYDQESSMLKSGLLLREVDQDIRTLDDGTVDGELQSRLCATAFLISRLPRDGGVDTGIRATADTLADLVVTDLTAGSADLRRRIPELLDALADTGRLLKVDGEYRLQTRQGQEWEADFRRRMTEIEADTTRMASDRGDALKDALKRSLGSLPIVQGKSKEARKITTHFGESRPGLDGQIAVWVRDGWATTESAVKAESEAAGLGDPVVQLFLPKRTADELGRTLATIAAAEEVVHTRTAGTDEAREAKRSIEARQAAAREKLSGPSGLIEEILRDATVYQGGGGVVLRGTTKEAVLKAAEASIVRLYPRFSEADHTGWGTVLNRAREGNAAALEAVGFHGDPKTHPVCAEVLAHIGAGKKGNEIVKHFGAPEYGWPKDAVNAALMTLLANELVVAQVDGIEQTAKQLTVTKLGVTTFKTPIGRAPSTDERFALRGLCADLGVSCPPGDEAAATVDLIRELIALAEATGGAAPLPTQPPTADLGDIKQLPGSERVIALAAMRDQLKGTVPKWKAAAGKAQNRVAEWDTTCRLAKHASGLAATPDVTAQLEAIREQRTLLTDPDPVQPLRLALVTATRLALAAAKDALTEAKATAREALVAADGWSALDAVTRDRLIEEHDLSEPTHLEIGTDDTLLAELDTVPLRAWADQRKAVPASFEAALLKAAQLAQPNQEVRAVKVPTATLKSPEDVKRYVEELTVRLDRAIATGTVVVS
jgi:hypothetical protein